LLHLPYSLAPQRHLDEERAERNLIPGFTLFFVSILVSSGIFAAQGDPSRPIGQGAHGISARRGSAWDSNEAS